MRETLDHWGEFIGGIQKLSSRLVFPIPRVAVGEE